MTNTPQQRILEAEKVIEEARREIEEYKKKEVAKSKKDLICFERSSVNSISRMVNQKLNSLRGTRQRDFENTLIFIRDIIDNERLYEIKND